MSKSLKTWNEIMAPLFCSSTTFWWYTAANVIHMVKATMKVMRRHMFDFFQSLR